MTLHYQYAEPGDNEYISVIVTDESSNALYYGRIAPATTENGSVEITLPAALAEGSYTLKVFNEQYNGDYKTDYASAPVDVTLTVEPLVTPDMTLEAESVTYGENCDVTVTLPDDATGTVSFKLTGHLEQNTYTFDNVAVVNGKAELHEKLNADDGYETVVTYSGDSQYAVPEKTGYTGAWPSYTLKAGGVRIDAVYETIPYDAQFFADGVLVDTVTYTVETTSIKDKEPAVPEKPGFTGAWPDYTLEVGGTRIDAVYEVIMQTVDFDANGGEGEMQSVTTAWGSKITLPECTFTAPNGKEFDKWDAGNPGDEIEVKSDLTVKAIWKEKPLTLTADVDPTQTGERIKITVPYARRGGIAATLTASEEGVRYESSKPGIISVDENGVIRLEKLCLFCKTATITAYSASGEKDASCVVNVKHAWWQYIIWLLLGSFWF